MQTRQHPTVARSIEQGEREALVAARFLERVEPNESDPLERAPLRALENRLTGDDLVELAGDTLDALEVRTEDGLETSAVAAPRQRREPSVEPSSPSREHEHGDEQDDDKDGEADDDGSDVGLDERVEIDPRNLRGGAASLAKPAHLTCARRGW